MGRPSGAELLRLRGLFVAHEFLGHVGEDVGHDGERGDVFAEVCRKGVAETSMMMTCLVLNLYLYALLPNEKATITAIPITAAVIKFFIQFLIFQKSTQANVYSTLNQ